MFILASSSPRRQELLKKVVPHFITISPTINEDILVPEHEYLPYELSKLKAYAIFATHPHDTILASDTIVLFKNQVLGKPKDKEDAKRMLRLLSGNMHYVVTAYTLISPHFEINRQVITRVYFHHLDEKFIHDYVEMGSPLDKAGAYGIQDQDFPCVSKIVGSHDNVMGLPTEDLAKALAKCAQTKTS